MPICLSSGMPLTVVPSSYVVLVMEDNTVSLPVDIGSPCVLRPDQSKWLQDLQVEFVDILSGSGSTSILEHTIDTGLTLTFWWISSDSKPFRLLSIGSLLCCSVKFEI